jgi:hypothetical protein
MNFGKHIFFSIILHSTAFSCIAMEIEKENEIKSETSLHITLEHQQNPPVKIKSESSPEQNQSVYEMKLKKFETMPFVGFRYEQDFFDLCYAQKQLEDFNPENQMFDDNNNSFTTSEKNQGNSHPSEQTNNIILKHQKTMYGILNTIQCTNLNVNPLLQLRLISLLTILRNRTTREKFVSEHFDIIGKYNAIIESLRIDLEQDLRVNPLHTPYAKIYELDEIALVDSCNKLSESLEKHYKINRFIGSFCPFSIEMIGSIMKDNQKN